MNNDVTITNDPEHVSLPSERIVKGILFAAILAIMGNAISGIFSFGSDIYWNSIDKTQEEKAQRTANIERIISAAYNIRQDAYTMMAGAINIHYRLTRENSGDPDFTAVTPVWMSASELDVVPSIYVPEVTVEAKEVTKEYREIVEQITSDVFNFYNEKPNFVFPTPISFERKYLKAIDRYCEILIQRLNQIASDEGLILKSHGRFSDTDKTSQLIPISGAKKP